MFISCLCFGWMGFMMKLAYINNQNLTGFDLLLIRSLLMWPVYYWIAKMLRVNLINVRGPDTPLLIISWITNAIGMAMLFISIKMLPTSIVFMIFNLNPLFVTLIAYVFLKEEYDIIKILSVIGAFLGVFIVGFGRRNETALEISQTVGIILCLTAALLWAPTVAIKRVLNQRIHYIISPYYLSISYFLIWVCVYVFDYLYINVQDYNGLDWIYLISAGTFALIGQLGLSLAVKFANASSVAPFTYVICLFNVFMDLFYFKFEFFIFDIIGSLLITVWIFVPVIILATQHYSQRHSTHE